jgi:hypothetical protein
MSIENLYEVYKLFDTLPIESLHELLNDLEKSEDYEACDNLKKYIDSRVRDNKLKEILD